MNLIAMILCILLIMSCGESIISSHKDAWNNANDPSQMKWPLDIGKMYQTAFNELPLFGSLEVTPWSGNYWPTYMGGISHRWNSSHPKSIQSYSYDISPDQENMSILSPAEKYDLYLGFYSMPLTRFERKRTQIMKTIDTSDAYDPQFKIPRWEGLCHAWAPATLGYKEPKPIEVTGFSGINIPFGSSDIKALLTYFLHMESSPSVILGERCYRDFNELQKKVAAGNLTRAELEDIKKSSSCKDTNAGAFHIVMANQLGVLKEGFIFDKARDVEVWNQAAFAFSSTVIETREGRREGSAPETVEEILISTQLQYIMEVPESWDGGSRLGERTITYSYWIELDSGGHIVGGAWSDDHNINDDRPDFLWKRRIPEFANFFKPLEALYKLSTSDDDVNEPLAD